MPHSPGHRQNPKKRDKPGVLAQCCSPQHHPAQGCSLQAGMALPGFLPGRFYPISAEGAAPCQRVWLCSFVSAKGKTSPCPATRNTKIKTLKHSLLPSVPAHTALEGPNPSLGGYQGENLHLKGKTAGIRAWEKPELPLTVPGGPCTAPAAQGDPGSVCLPPRRLQESPHLCHSPAGPRLCHIPSPNPSGLPVSR